MPPCATTKCSRPYWLVATTLAVGLLQMNTATFLSIKVSTVDLQKLRPDVVLTLPDAVLIRGLTLQKRMQRSRRKAFLKHVAFGVNPSEHYVQSEWGTHWTHSKSCDVFRNRKAAGNSTVASYASFGPNHQYYIEFPDRIYFKIDDAEILRLVKEKQPVKFVSFGPQGAVVLVLKSGAYYFRNIPVGLQDCITGRARSGNQDHNQIASVLLGNNDAYFVTFEDGGWKYQRMPESMHEYINENIKNNYPNETFEQIAVSQDLEEWYLDTNRRWWYQSRTLRGMEDKYKSAFSGPDVAKT